MAPEEKLCDQKFDLNAARRLGRKVVPGPSNRITLRCSQRSASAVFVDWYSTCLACILQSLRRHNKVLRHNGARLHRVMGAEVVVEQRVHSWTPPHIRDCMSIPGWIDCRGGRRTRGALEQDPNHEQGTPPPGWGSCEVCGRHEAPQVWCRGDTVRPGNWWPLV